MLLYAEKKNVKGGFSLFLLLDIFMTHGTTTFILGSKSKVKKTAEVG